MLRLRVCNVYSAYVWGLLLMCTSVRLNPLFVSCSETILFLLVEFEIENVVGPSTLSNCAKKVPTQWLQFRLRCTYLLRPIPYTSKHRSWPPFCNPQGDIYKRTNKTFRCKKHLFFLYKEGYCEICVWSE